MRKGPIGIESRCDCREADKGVFGFSLRRMIVWTVMIGPTNQRVKCVRILVYRNMCVFMYLCKCVF
jgi:hypothetical protein